MKWNIGTVLREMLGFVVDVLYLFYSWLTRPSLQEVRQMRRKTKAQQEEITHLRQELLRIQGEKADLERLPFVLRDSIADLLQMSEDELASRSRHIVIKCACGWENDVDLDNNLFKTKRDAYLYGMLLDAVGYRDNSEENEDEVKENEAA